MACSRGTGGARRGQSNEALAVLLTGTDRVRFGNFFMDLLVSVRPAAAAAADSLGPVRPPQRLGCPGSNLLVPVPHAHRHGVDHAFVGGSPLAVAPSF